MEMTLEQQVIADWKNNPNIRNEFGDISRYFHYAKAEKEGKVKIIKKEVHKN